ncbi:MAG: adenylate cyclase [Afipia sp. 62-7]|nr:MAG: adenylate cyclase [Afipia sp. 62-7]
MSGSDNRSADMTGDTFYSAMPVFHGFASLMEPSLYRPVPDGWLIGVADIVQSTRAIADNRYKAVNMAGAAVIASITNALDGRDFPFAFGGDGASFSVAPQDAERARDALAATATWVRDDLDLILRVALVPIAAIRAQGLDVCIARYAPSPHVSYAMFSGGGLAFADAAMKRGEFAVEPAAAGAHPDLTGLSCRFSEIPSERGVILSVLVVPSSADGAAYRRLIEDVVALVERSPGAGRPVPANGPPLRWPAEGARYEALARRGPSLLIRQFQVQVRTLFVYAIFRLGVPVGGFLPKVYMQQVVENSDFRKYDDGLRMVLDCTPELADALESRLAAAAAAGVARYGLHRQDAAMMTCFTLSATRPEHFHFVDGARGGYASAATALKAALN